MRISPLRQRMIDDITARHFGEKTQKDYIRCVKNLAAFTGRAPETATAEDLRLYRLDQGGGRRCVSLEPHSATRQFPLSSNHSGLIS